MNSLQLSRKFHFIPRQYIPYLILHKLNLHACSIAIHHAMIDQLLKQPLCFFFPSGLGLLFIFKHLLSLVIWAYIILLRPQKDFKVHYGSWAVITGSTDGIGKAFAFQLAKNGLNIILVSRNPDKLKQVSDEIQQNFPDVRVKHVVVDFAGHNLVDRIHEIERAIEGLDVGILINNVGVTYPRAMYFHEVDEDIWMKLVKVNLEGTTRVTRAVLTGMLKRKRGAIVNISSGAGIVAPSHPLYAIYAATKVYIDQLSRSLTVEYKCMGIDVQCQVPLYVATTMASSVACVKSPSLFIPSAEQYAAAAVRRIGYEARCTPYWTHSIQWCVASMVPESWLDAWRLSVGTKRKATSCT